MVFISDEKWGRGSAIMELGMLIMPYCVKITYEIDENDDWLEGLDTINDFLWIRIFILRTYSISKKIYWFR